MKIKKQIAFLFIATLFASCNDQDEKKELQPLASSEIELSYPSGIGTSGDEKYGLIGYGYDATGFCDTISVKSKVLSNIPTSGIYLDYPTSAFPTLVSGRTFKELSDKINMPYMVNGSGEILAKHLQSLMKLANKSDLVNSTYEFTYYAITSNYAHCAINQVNDMQQYLSSEFKNDIVNLSSENIVSKYGTHVLMDLFLGSKFEVLYLCKQNLTIVGGDCENQFHKRMNQFVGGTPFIVRDVDLNSKNAFIDEKLIYNTMGLRKKLCGVINATDYNPDSVRINLKSAFSEENIKTQFITIAPRGILPLYELINVENKKQELKVYIENYMNSKSAN